MTLNIASPVCTVNNTALATSGTTGYNATSGSTITIALANSAGVSSWSISATSADDVTSSNGNLTAINNSKLFPTPYSATFILPAISGGRGCSIQFTSIVNGGNSPGTKVTFGVFVLNTNGTRLWFGGESLESDATVGNAAGLNTLISAVGASATAAGDVTGLITTNTVVKIQGVPVSSTAPTDGQALVYSSSSGSWQPGAGGGGSSSSTWAALTADGSFHTIYTLTPSVASDETVTIAALTKIRGAANTGGVFVQRDIASAENESGTLTFNYPGSSTTIDTWNLGSPPAGAAVQMVASGTTVLIQAKATSGGTCYACTNVSLDRSVSPATTVTLSSVTPTHFANSSSTSFVITGTGLASASGAGVLIASTKYPMTITSQNSTTITGTISVSVVGKGVVYVTSAGVDTTGLTYWSLSASSPSITSLTPNNGFSSGGTSVAIVGTGFTGVDIPTAGAIQFTDGTNSVNAASYTYNSDTSVTAITGSDGSNSGTGNCILTTPAGSGTKPWTYSGAQPAPTVSSISYDAGSAAGQSNIQPVITGTNFFSVTSVKLAGVEHISVATVNSSTQITLSSVLAGTATLHGDVTVTTGGGTGGTGDGYWTYLPANYNMWNPDHVTFGTSPAVASMAQIGDLAASAASNATASRQPNRTNTLSGTNSQNLINYLNGSGAYLTVATIPAQTAGELFILHSNSGGGPQMEFGSGTSGLYDLSGSMYDDTFSTARYMTAVSLGTTVPFIYQVAMTTGGAATAWVNGTQIFTNTGNTVGVATSTTFNPPGATGSNTTYQHGIVMVYNRTLSTGERTIVKSYLGTKYGISVS